MNRENQSENTLVLTEDKRAGYLLRHAAAMGDLIDPAMVALPFNLYAPGKKPILFI